MSEQPHAQPPLTINVQYVKDLSFEVPGAPEIFAMMREMPPVNIRFDLSSQMLGEGVYEVVLELAADAESDGRPAFVAELSYGAVVTLAGIPEENIEPVLAIEVPRLLFPFARNIIADMVRDGGFPALMLAPIDFVSLYRQRQAEAEAEA